MDRKIHRGRIIMGVAASRIGDKCIVHCSLPVVGAGSPNVLVNGLSAARIGDPIVPHLKPSGDKCVPHSTTIASGSPTVFVNGLAAAHIGSALVACTTIAEGSPNVHWGT